MLKNLFTIILLVLLFVFVGEWKQLDRMQAINHEMVERCTIDMAINPELICD